MTPLLMKSFTFERTSAWLALLVAVALSGCKPKAATQTAERRAEPVAVSVISVTNVEWSTTVPIVGTLFPKDEATVGAQVEGMVEATMVDFGDRVKAGQDLAFIDTALYDAQLAQASGNLAKAEANSINAAKNLSRLSKLRKEGVASESDLDQAVAQAAQWDAEIKAARGSESVARLNLQRSKVQAPFDGAVSQRIVGKGDFAKVGAPLFNLVNDSVLKFIFAVPEKYASYVRKGLPVQFSVDNYPTETFSGKVYLISPAVSTSSRSFSVGALVTNLQFRLKASTFARGTLVIEEAKATPVVPVDSVVNFAGITKVFVKEGEVAKSRLITTGRIRDGVQEVLEGLRAGETVIVSGQSRLSDGDPVVVNSGAARSGGPAATDAKTR